MDDTAINLTHLPDKVSQCLSSHQNKMAQYLFEMAHMDGLEDLSSRRALPRDFSELKSERCGGGRSGARQGSGRLRCG